MPDRHKQLLSERPQPWRSPRGLDILDGWREGYVHVLSIHPTLLDNRVFDTLRECDIWAQGGIARVNKALDDAVAQERASVDKDIQNWNESASREAHDMLQWRLGNRMVMSHPVRQGPIWVRGSGVKITDKRRVHAIA